MSKQYPQVRKAIYGEPWAIIEAWYDAIAEIAETHIEAVARGEQVEWEAADKKAPAQKDELQIDRGVAVIPVTGPIIKGANSFQRMSGATSPRILSNQFHEALENDDVSATMLHFDSPGGSVLGIQEFASEIFEARSKTDKPIIAFADGVMASAAYWFGSQADAVYATEMSQVGGLGVYSKFYDDTRMQQNQGIDPVVIRSHELKGIGEGPMTPNQLSAMQQKVLRIANVFKGTVARARTGMDVEALFNGLTWFGQEAVDNGLVDEITTYDSLIERYGKESA